MGQINKAMLSKFIMSECERQLFLEMGKDDASWISPLRPVEKDDFPRHSYYLENEGKAFEQRVYDCLKKLPGVVYHGYYDDDDKRYPLLTRELLLDAHRQCTSTRKPTVLIEHQLYTPRSFLVQLYPPKGTAIPATPASFPVESRPVRPDILILQTATPEDTKDGDGVRAFMPDGSTCLLAGADVQGKVGITILDNKFTNEDKVNKKQFMEIMYYAWNISCYLKENGLDGKFFVHAKGNGIVPRDSTAEPFSVSSVDELRAKVVEVRESEGERIMSYAATAVRSLWRRAPCPIEDVPLKIQPTCGFCSFLNDCAKSLKAGGEEHPESWAIDLIPYTSVSTIQQLKDAGFHTIADVAKNIRKLPLGSTPNPIYPEITRLEMKANALLFNKEYYPAAGMVHAYSIPKFTPIAITFCIEYDQGNEIVFAAGLRFTATMPPDSPHALRFEHWCNTWGRTPGSADLDAVKPALERLLLMEVKRDDLAAYQEAVKGLGSMETFFKGDPTKKGEPTKQTFMRFNFANVNQGIDKQDEESFVKSFVDKVHAIMVLCNILERYLACEDKIPGKVYAPNTGIFYWAEEQRLHLQDMLERHVKPLVNDPAMKDKFSEVITWFTPSDSEVNHPYQHRKLYDIQAFVETVVGFPHIINYSWHRIGKKILGMDKDFNRYFWLPHFNYMDFHPWHDYLNMKKGDVEKRKEKRESIVKQILHKIRTIDELRRHFQIDAGRHVSRHSKPMPARDYGSVRLGEEHNAFARVWFMYAKLSGAMAEWEAEYFRTMYPEYSIGKLAAAEIEDLKIIKNPDESFWYNFILRGMSANMKVAEGDRVLLIPEELRDLLIGQWNPPWVVEIEDITWDASIPGYSVRTAKTKHNLQDLYVSEVTDKVSGARWYIYPTARDNWSRKLYSNNGKTLGLLERKNLGTSWLGFNLAQLWDVSSRHPLSMPRSWKFDAPEAYLYAPALLGAASKPVTPLLTSVHFPPDPSQAAAIQEALSRIVYGIQGPPGTGKTQTIAALIDEFYLRQKQAGRQARVLVTAFSYAAIRVIIDKILKSNDASGKSTPVARMQLVFLRSENQEPCGDSRVHDLEHGASSWKWDGQGRLVTEKKPLDNLLEEDFILFANAHQLYYLNDRVTEDFVVDMIVVDEASQVPIDHILASLQYVKPNDVCIKPAGSLPVKDLALAKPLDIDEFTKLVVVGDYNQLPPVQPVPPPKNLEKALSSLFTYYVQNHDIHNKQLETNYRSHEDIVRYTNGLKLYNALQPAAFSARSVLAGNLDAVAEPWIKDVLQPADVVSAIIHDKRYEISVSPLESHVVASLVVAYLKMVAPATPAAEEQFWRENVGIVSPHNAQGRMIIHEIYEELVNKGLTRLAPGRLVSMLKSTVYSVEKFQGSDRNLIIASIGVSDRDQLRAEEEFIYDLNRFNVLTTRAKNKVVLVCSEEYLNYIPQERDVMENVGKIRGFAMTYCNQQKDLVIDDDKGNKLVIKKRWHGKTPAGGPFPASYEARDDGFVVTVENDAAVASWIDRLPATVARDSIPTGDARKMSWHMQYRDVPEIRKHFPLDQSIVARHHRLVVSSTGPAAAMAKPAPATPSTSDAPQVDGTTNKDEKNPYADLF